jgi:hypothetical protein
MEENNDSIDLRTNNPQRSPMVKFSVSVMTFILLFAVISPASALCISNEKANLRKGPGIKHEKLWQVFQYMPFKLLRAPLKIAHKVDECFKMVVLQVFI